MDKAQVSDINRIIEAVQLLKGAFYEASAGFSHKGPVVARLDNLQAQLEQEIELDSLVTDLEHLIKYGAK